MNCTQIVRIARNLVAVWNNEINFGKLITEEDMEQDLFYRG